MSVNRVVLIRPGETEWNKIGRWQGTVAVPLNENGREQAKRLAKFVRNVGLEAIYSSDVRRARETAAILSEYANVPIKYDERLRERYLGLWQGLTMNEIKDWYKKEYAELMADALHAHAPLGESRKEVADRVLSAFEDIQALDYQTVGIISHTTAIRVLLTQLIDDIKPFDIEFRNMSVTTIMLQDDGKWKLTQLDDVSHLEGLEAKFFKDRIG